MVLVEAMSEGRPFVGTPVGSVPELAEAGGLLAPVGDAKAVADRITELLANPERAMELGERGRRFCEQTRSTEVMDASFRELYEYARSCAQ
jgi:glycosyltransferase involved in cell wall biosynthesis